MAIPILGSDGAIITSGLSGKSRRLDVSSRGDTRLFYVSRDDGQAYSWTGVYASGANETVLLVKNTSTTRDLIITEIEFVSDAATRVRIHLPTVEVTPGGGATIVGRNLNTGSTNAAEATGKQNESDNALGNIILDTLIGVSEPHGETWEDGLRITQNKSIAVDFVTAASALGGATIIGYFEIKGT